MVKINFCKNDIYGFLKEDLPNILDVSEDDYDFFMNRINKIYSVAMNHMLEMKIEEGRPVVGLLANNHLGEREIIKNIIEDDYEIVDSEDSLKDIANLLFDNYNDRPSINERLKNISGDMSIREFNRAKLLDLINLIDDEIVELNKIYCHDSKNQWVNSVINNYCTEKSIQL